MTQKGSFILLAGAFLLLGMIDGRRDLSQDLILEHENSILDASSAYSQQKSTATSAPRSFLHDGLGLHRGGRLYDEVNRVAKGVGLDLPVFMAITLTIVSCSVSSLGLALQKLSHVHADANQAVTAPSQTCTINRLYFLRLRWAFGFLVYIAGHIIGLVALSMGPQSILSSLNWWTMIMTFVYGVLLLGENVHFHRVLSSLICIAGSLILIHARPANAEALTAAEWLWRLGSVDFLAFFAIILLVACCVAMHISAALRWALLAAALSWLSVIGAKGIAGIALDVDLTAWQSWVLLSMTVAVALSNVHFLNVALQLGEITLVLPFYEMMALAGQAIVGGVFFGEFTSFHTILQIASFSMGLLLISCGLLSMTGHEINQSHQDDHSQKGEKETYYKRRL